MTTGEKSCSHDALRHDKLTNMHKENNEFKHQSTTQGMLQEPGGKSGMNERKVGTLPRVETGGKSGMNGSKA
jgi:hypothetical protein